jgi:hypothetical protein
MKIKTIFYTFFLLCILIINTASSADTYSANLLNINEIDINRKSFCRQYLIHYGLNINIRSQMGWIRVIKNNNLHLYTNENFSNISTRNRYIFEQCIINPEYNDRKIFDRGDQQ